MEKSVPKKKRERKRLKAENYPTLSSYLRYIDRAETVADNLNLIGETKAEGFECELQRICFTELKIATETESLTKSFENLITQILKAHYSYNHDEAWQSRNRDCAVGGAVEMASSVAPSPETRLRITDSPFPFITKSIGI